MDVEVVVLAERSTRALRRWRVADLAAIPSLGWEDLAIEFVRRAHQGSRGAGEVYLCYRGDKVGEYYDHEFLEGLIRASRAHTWGSRVYIVLDTSLPVAMENAWEYFPALEEWLYTAKNGGVAGLLQTEIDLAGLREIDTALLRSSCDRLLSVRTEIQAEDANHKWQVRLLGHGARVQLYEEFLGSAICTGVPFRTTSNLLIAISETGAEGCEDAIDKMLEAYGCGAIIAAVGMRPNSSLRHYCSRRGLPLLRLRGFFELKFILMSVEDISSHRQSLQEGVLSHQLNQADSSVDQFSFYEAGLTELRRRVGTEHPRARHAAIFESRLMENIRTTRMEGDSESRTEARNQILYSIHGFALDTLGLDFNRLCEVNEHAGKVSALANDGRGLLIVTTSLNPEEERLCLLAAQSVGRLVEKAHPLVVPYVHLAVTCEVLRAMVEDTPNVVGWIFIGQARGPQGLQEATSGRFVDPSAWLSCFQGQKRVLRISLFLACNSTETAQHFANNGVHCAIGFGHTVFDEVLVHVSRNLLETLLNVSFDRQAMEARVREMAGGNAFFSRDND